MVSFFLPSRSFADALPIYQLTSGVAIFSGLNPFSCGFGGSNGSVSVGGGSDACFFAVPEFITGETYSPRYTTQFMQGGGPKHTGSLSTGSGSQTVKLIGTTTFSTNPFIASGLIEFTVSGIACASFSIHQPRIDPLGFEIAGEQIGSANLPCQAGMITFSKGFQVNNEMIYPDIMWQVVAAPVPEPATVLLIVPLVPWFWKRAKNHSLSCNFR